MKCYFFQDFDTTEEMLSEIFQRYLSDLTPFVLLMMVIIVVTMTMISNNEIQENYHFLPISQVSN